MRHAPRARSSAPSSLAVLPLGLALGLALPLSAGCAPSTCPEGTALDDGSCVGDGIDGGVYLACARVEQRFDDVDGDGFGDPDSATCEQDPALVDKAGDCDDRDRASYPGAAELCNGLDDDCDGAADQSFACVAGEVSECTTTCGSIGSSACSGTCEASAECVPPVEVCNGVDDDCDGAVDEELAELLSAPAFGEVGDEGLGLVASPTGYVAFTRRNKQLLAQPLDEAGTPSGEPKLYFAITPLTLGTVSVTANDSHAFLAYIADDLVFATSFDLETLAFGLPVQVPTEDLPIGVSAAATDSQVIVAYARYDGADALAGINTVSFDTSLSAMSSSVVASTYWSSSLRTLGFTLAPPQAEGAPWPLTYFSAPSTDLTTPHHLMGINSSGGPAVDQRILETFSSPDRLRVNAGAERVVLWSVSDGALAVTGYDPLSLAAQGARQELASQVVGVSAGFAYAQGFAAAYVDGSGSAPKLTLARLSPTLELVDTAELPAPVTDARALAAGASGLAALAGGEGTRPAVYVLGCPAPAAP